MAANLLVDLAPTIRTTQKRIMKRAPLSSLTKARPSASTDKCRRSFNKEIRTHKAFDTFTEVCRQQLPPGTEFFRLVPTFYYKTSEHGHITGQKVRLCFPRNRLLPHIHKYLLKLAVHAADRASGRLYVALAVTHGIWLKHENIAPAFLQEKYAGHEPLHVEQILTFETHARTATTVMRVIGNIYSMRQMPRVYADGLQHHLTKCGYVHRAADRNLYVKREADEVVVLAFTVDDICIAASSEAAYL